MRLVLHATGVTCCASVLAFSRGAPAQVNTEPLRREIRGDGVGLHLAQSITTYQGNTQGLVFGASVLFGGRLGRHFGYLSASGDYSHLAGSTQAAKGFAHVRNNYQLTSRLWSELFGQLDADRFRRIALRELVGAGPRLAVLQTEAVTLFLGTSYMLEYTRLSQSVDVRDTSSVAHRSNNYVAFTWILGEQTTLSETLYLQPRFDEPSDWKGLSVTNLEFRLTTRLSSRIDATAHYDTRQPPGVKAFDLEIRNLLDLRL